MTNCWLDQKVSLYRCYRDNKGTVSTFRDVLLTNFAVPHQWSWFEKKTRLTHKGISNDLETMIKLRKLDRLASDYKSQAKKLKNTLQCYTPAGLFASKAKDNVIEISRTGLMQLDFDYDDIGQYDINELMQSVFDLPFIAFCGLSCSGYGFYALAMIAEADKLSEYAEHCFRVLEKYCVNADESKGKGPENLRYLSYHENMLIRVNPEPLYVNQFKTKPIHPNKVSITGNIICKDGVNRRLNKGLKLLQNVQPGNRWTTIRKVSYTIGGLGNHDYLNYIIDVLTGMQVFQDDLVDFIDTAVYCFERGMMKPFNK